MGAKAASTDKSQASHQDGGDEPRARDSREVLAIGRISTDAGTQVRSEINDKTVADYADHLNAAGEFPPITVLTQCAEPSRSS